MAKNFLIGIGGTGCRVAEAALHLCAAGFGPDELTLIIVDPDKGNGNLNRMSQTAIAYQTLQEVCRLAKVPLMKTNITLPDKFVWHIFEDKERLERYINYANIKDAPLGALARTLFSPQELATDLSEGFRGHPSIGAVVMSNIPNEQPWSKLFEAMNNANENDVRVHLVGSIFGGTGASGIPTLGSPELIKFNPQATIDRAAGRSKVLLGCSLILPYFSIEEGEDSEGKMFVSNSDFPIATKAALQYYAVKDLAFDQFYFIGDSLAQNVGKFSPGSVKQENSPHYIEIIAALAAFDFFAQEQIPDAKQYYISTRGEASSISWSDLPVSRDSGKIPSLQQELKRKLAIFSTFSMAMVTYGKYKRNSNLNEIRDTWYRENFKKAENDETINIQSSPNSHVLSQVENYANLFLNWISEIDEKGEDKVKLINSENIKKYRGDYEPNFPDRMVIHSLLKNEEVSRKKYSFSDFISLQNRVKVTGDVLSGAHRFIQIFYKASEEYCKANYTTLT